MGFSFVRAVACVLVSSTIAKNHRHLHRHGQQQHSVAGGKGNNASYVSEYKHKDVERCSFQLNEDMPRTPLILRNLGDPELLYPDAEYDIIHVSTNEKIKLTCLDKEFIKFHAKTLVAKCLDDGRVLVRGRKMNLNELECEKFPSSTLLRTNRTCHGNGTEYAVGFQLSKRFLKTMSICFDETEKKAMYSWYESTKLHIGHQKNVQRPQFAHDNIYDFDVNKAYFRKEQIKSLAKTLGSKALAEKYIQSGNSMYYLARGHLTPKADFVYGSEQASTFHYVNVAPQWQLFNQGNWEKVEENVRKLLLEHSDRYNVLTGTYGVATLPDVDSQQQELYLHVDDSEKQLPIPKLFWKTIYDKETCRGVTIVGVNNPYIEDIPQDYVICEDICDQVDWFDVDTKNVDRGYLYCCDTEEFLRVTDYENIFEQMSVRQVNEETKEGDEEEEKTDELEEESTIESSNQSVIIASNKSEDRLPARIAHFLLSHLSQLWSESHHLFTHIFESI